MEKSLRQEARYGVFSLQLSVLEDALLLPSGYSIVSAQYDMSRQIINFLVESASLPETPEDAPLPQIGIDATVEHHPENPEYRKMTGKVVVS